MSIGNHVIHLRNGVLHAESTRSRIDDMVRDALGSGARRPIVVHFHGGLVKYATGLEGASRLLPIYQQAGSYPFFFIWESGLLETIRNNLKEVATEKIFQIIWKRVRKIIERKLAQVADGRDLGDLPQPTDEFYATEIDDALASGSVADLMNKDFRQAAQLSELTAAEVQMLELELGYDIELLSAVEAISNALRDPHDVETELNSRSATVQASVGTLMDPHSLEKIVERPDPAARGIISSARVIQKVVQIAVKVIARFVKDRDHGLHATIVEEILHALYLGNVGGFIWSNMKKDTADSFGPDPQTFGGSAFIDSIKEQHNADASPRIILIGHSTGAVYISEFIKYADAHLPPHLTFEIIFLAPASTFRLMSETVESYKHRIAGIRMFTMTDENEKKDELVPILYPHSLLYFVSGVVEPEIDMPIVGMQRFYDEDDFSQTKFPAVATVREYLRSIPDSIVWSVEDSAGPGLKSTSRSHGDFDNDATTLASVSHIIQNGF